MEAIVTPASRLAFGEADDPSEAAAWMQDAACRSADPELFFPGQGNGTADGARAVCATCPVVTACLDFAAVNGISEGVFGGLTAAQRKRRGGHAAS